MRNQYKSIYGNYISQFIDFKRTLGFKYKTEETVLSYFDRFVLTQGEKNVGITKELAEAWLHCRPNESSSYKVHRCICINQFGSFLCKQGIPSYMLQLPRHKSTFTPYIFSLDQMNVIYKTCDGLRAIKKRMDSPIFIMPSLIRLLYATGLRISEALSLKNSDINLSDQTIIVRDSKNRKERMIPVSLSLSGVLSEYQQFRQKLPLQKPVSDYFFINLCGRKCQESHISKLFRKTLWLAGISRVKQGPRLHDLRHTFSVHALAMMAEQGIDLYCSLPTLSTYLGHQSLEATNIYVRLTAEMYPGLIKDVDLICLNVFPNTSSYATH
jgi:integrase/recombinase XerD